MKSKIKNYHTSLFLKLIFLIFFIFFLTFSVVFGEDSKNNLVFLLQNSYLIYIDIFLQTYPAITYHNDLEPNPIARTFFNNNQWTLAYISAITANYLVASLLNNIDNSGTFSMCFLGIVAIIETYVISLNQKWMDGYKEKSCLNFYITCFVYEF